MTKSNRRRTLTEAQKRAMIRRKAAENARKKKKSGTSKRVEAPYPHFRYFKKSQHPALIVGEQKTEQKEEYRYRKVMHGDRDGRHLNEEIYPNPDPKDPDPMHIARRVRHEEKKHFNDTPLPWKYPKK